MADGGTGVKQPESDTNGGNGTILYKCTKSLRNIKLQAALSTL
jgi:hypothetical protein